MAIALAGLTLAGCVPAPVPTASGFTFDHVTAAIAPGFRGTATFGCGGDVALTVTGSGRTITVSVPGSDGFAMAGGPLAYRGDRGAIDFRPDYAGFTWTTAEPSLARLACRA